MIASFFQLRWLLKIHSHFQYYIAIVAHLYWGLGRQTVDWSSTVGCQGADGKFSAQRYHALKQCEEVTSETSQAMDHQVCCYKGFDLIFQRKLQIAILIYLHILRYTEEQHGYWEQVLDWHLHANPEVEVDRVSWCKDHSLLWWIQDVHDHHHVWRFALHCLLEIQIYKIVDPYDQCEDSMKDCIEYDTAIYSLTQHNPAYHRVARHYSSGKDADQVQVRQFLD